MALLMAISDRSHSVTPLGGPNIILGFIPMAQNGLFIALKLAQNGPKWPKNYIFKHQLFEDAALFALENSKDARGFGQSST